MDLGLIPKPEIDYVPCKVCIQSKYAQKPFKSVERSSGLLGRFGP